MEKVVIDPARCKGCALCTTVCPKDLIVLRSTMNRYGFLPAEVVEGGQELCISCAMCARVCPDLAITVFREEKVG